MIKKFMTIRNFNRTMKRLNVMFKVKITEKQMGILEYCAFLGIGDVVKEYPMKPRHLITKEYNANKGRQRRWKLTIDYLMNFGIEGKCLDCGDITGLTHLIRKLFKVKIINTTYNLDCNSGHTYNCNNVFIFEVIEHLMNPLFFMKNCQEYLKPDGSIYLSTPINRPNFMRNKEHHFHEFNYNELVYLINKAGLKIVDEKIINITKWYMMFTGFRPLLRVFGFGNNILLRLKRK